MAEKRLIIATHNPAKLAELSLGVKPLIEKGIVPVSLTGLHIDADPEETGQTFEENAILKAKFYSRLTGLPVIADDGGLTIDTLNGEPGVHSKRWLGRDAQDTELIAYTLERMKNVPDDKRTAALQTTLCYFNPETNALFLESGKVAGSIAAKPSPHPVPGYPYRSLFIVSRFGKYYDELSPAEHEAINHRLQAVSRLIKQIQPDLVK